MQTDTSEREKKPCPESGRGFPFTSLFLSPLPPWPHPYPQICLFCYYLRHGGRQSRLFTEGIACWVILGEIHGFLTQSPGNQQLLPLLMCSSLVSDMGKHWNFPVLLRGMEGVEDRLTGEKCIFKGAYSRVSVWKWPEMLPLFFYIKKFLFYSVWLPQRFVFYNITAYRGLIDSLRLC